MVCVLLVFCSLLEYATILYEGVRPKQIKLTSVVFACKAGCSEQVGRRTARQRELQQFLASTADCYHTYPTPPTSESHLVTRLGRSNIIQVCRPPSIFRVSSLPIF